ncbi:MAG: DnaB-like helicase C-terminal domain-containing protein [Planctomycetia bacterium]|jgi:replicative DNA helicase
MNTEPIEISVIGSMLVDSTRSEAVFSAPELLFASERGKTLFKGVNELYKSNYDLSPETLAVVLQSHGLSADDASTLVGMAVSTAAKFDHLPFLIKSLSSNRVTSLRMDLSKALGEDTPMRMSDVLAKVSEFQRNIALLDDHKATTYEGAMLELTKQQSVKHFVPGMGLLDNVLQIDEGTVCYIGGRSGGGKTAFALNMMYNIAKAGHSVGIIEVEMRRKPIAARLSGVMSRLNTRRVMKGEMNDMEREHLESAVHKHKQTLDRIRGIEPSAFHADMVKPTLERWRDEWGCEIVMIDYVQILQGKGSDRTKEVQYISRAITEAAKSTNIPIVALSQARRSEGNVTMSDFKESAQLEHDADTMVTLNQADGYVPGAEVKQVWCELVKNRNGLLSRDLLDYHLPTQTFSHTGRIKNDAPKQEEQSPF